MSAVRQAWKAVVAFFAPGLLLLAERVLLTDGDVDRTLLTRALIVGVATSVVVWATKNGYSRNPGTSTPGPETGVTTVDLCLAVLFLLVLLLVLGVLPTVGSS